MKKLSSHESTAQEETVFNISCAILDELEYVGEAHKNVEIVVEGIAFVPDLYLPGLGLVVSTDGRIHEYGYEQERLRKQQVYDANKDILFKAVGIDIFIVHGHETANRASLAVRLRTLFKDRINNGPSDQQLAQTSKQLWRERNLFNRKYPFRSQLAKTGSAGTMYGRKVFHHFFGFKVIFRKKART